MLRNLIRQNMVSFVILISQYITGVGIFLESHLQCLPLSFNENFWYNKSCYLKEPVTYPKVDI